MRIFRKIIEFENKYFEGKKEITEWDSKEAAEFSNQIKQKQDLLVSFGLVPMLCKIITNEEDKFEDSEIKYEAVLTSIALLYGGNQNAQENFYQYLIYDRKNDFLINIKTIIEEDFAFIRKAMNNRNKYFTLRYFSKEENLNLVHDDNKTLVENINAKISTPELAKKEEESSSLDEIPSLQLETIERIKRIKDIFRMLQLFCEGHNLDMQNSLRTQILVGGFIHSKSQDFITLTALKFGQIIRFIFLFENKKNN